MSNLVGNFLYTTKKQWIFSSRSNIFLDKNKWILVGDWRYFITSQPTFGLGSSAPNELEENPSQLGVYRGEQQMDFSLIRFYETILRRVGESKFYLGIGYHFDQHARIENFFDEKTPPSLEFAHDAYNRSLGFAVDRYILSGITFNAIMENRDIPVSPYEKKFRFDLL